eukprot:2503935-Alexandrium_andersonii.AAC.1
MFHAGWVFHPGVFAPEPGAPAVDVATGVWYHPVTQATCTHAQARRPSPGGLVRGGPAPVPLAPAATAVKLEQKDQACVGWD